MLKPLMVAAALISVLAAKSQMADSTALKIKEIEESIVYNKGKIELPAGNAHVTVPSGFRFLDKNQSIYVLTELWGNPADSSIIGMLVPEGHGVLEPESWAFTISYDEMGFVKDDDASDINYDDLLKDQQKEMREENPERIKEGYSPIEFVGWASAPYYDKNKKILHWAKSLRFGDDSVNTLNYNLRVLGRKGIFMLNAVASVNQLPEVKANISKVIESVEFKEGSRYSDFNPDVDAVAAWTIGGLVAGKILAKVGLFAMVLKFWKIIAMAVAGFGGSIWKFVKRRKKSDPLEPEMAEVPVPNDESSVS